MKTLKMVGPRPRSKFSKCHPRRRPFGAATGDTASQGQQRCEGSRVAAPTTPKRNVENLKRRRSPPEATFSKFGLRPIGEATPFQPPSSALLPDETESALATRPAPRWAGVRIGRLSRRLLCVCIPFVPGPPGEEGGSLTFVKRESLFKWAVRAPFPGQRAQSPSASYEKPPTPTPWQGRPPLWPTGPWIYRFCFLRLAAFEGRDAKPFQKAASTPTSLGRARKPPLAGSGTP